MISQRQLFLNHVAQTSDAPLMLEIERAKGCYLYDTEGVPYLDLIAGISVSVLGHRHKKVQKAVEKQVKRYWHTLVYGEFVLSPQVKLATLLTKHLPTHLDSVYFTNSGTEATEGAMKLAKRHTGRREIIACRNAYHGSTQGAMSLMSDTYFTENYQPLLRDIQWITFNDFSDINKITNLTAAVIVETIQAEGGIIVPTEGYLRALKNHCEAVGALLIVDEIQAGMGRTGSLWAFEQQDFEPDILLLANGLGGGMPIGAFISSHKIMQSLTHNPVLGHITTFGGHPVSAAAAYATLRFLIKSEVIHEVKYKENIFKKRLVHPQIKAVRSAGLWLAVELESFDYIQKVIKECLKNGVLTDWFLFNDKSLRIAPPLTISIKQINKACDVILAAIEKYA